MSLITERFYDKSKPLYIARNVKFDGRDYKKGDEAPVKDMSLRTILKYFRTGLFVHEVRQLKTEEVKAEVSEVAEEAPKPAAKKRGRKKAE